MKEMITEINKKKMKEDKEKKILEKYFNYF